MNNHMHLLKLLDYTPAEIQQFLATAADLTAPPLSGGQERCSALREGLHPYPLRL